MSGYPYQQQPGSQPYRQPQPASSNPFAEQVNPYAAPHAMGMAYPQAAAPPPSKYPGLWRQGKILVMHKAAPLPDICLKSNQPATKRLKRNLQWHHPLIALSILAGLLIYIILALILTKRATIMVPLTDEWYERRKRRLIFSWVAGLAFLGLMVLGIVLAVQMEDGMYAWLILIGFLGGLFTLIIGQIMVGLVSPKRITDDYVWLKGVHPDFLNRLDVWMWNV
jgi:hypothetical protein